LIRDGLRFEKNDLVNYYTQDYQYNRKKFGEEHIFFASNGPIPRSKVIHDWILELKPEDTWKNIRKVLEVGCGQGNLLSRLSLTFPEITFEGVELSERAANAAQMKELKVSHGSVDEASFNQYDVIICFGVLEHVPSPTTFLQKLKHKLCHRGEIISGQPIQDIGHYDLFYVDHLHHFESRHITLLSQKLGLSEKNVFFDHPLLRNFSLHLIGLERKHLSNLCFESNLASTKFEKLKKWFNVFEKINDEVNKLKPTDNLAVFGVSEIFALFYAYTNLPKAPVVCALDDSREYQSKNPWPFPVIPPEEATEFRITKIFLCVNPTYNDFIIPRLKPLGAEIKVFLS
jgi:2-polyprenyl-3-methyl-5-hydroxy-6-metoxy-1,4-benzoquinol methylase